MKKVKDQSKDKSLLVPTLGNLASIEKSFERARKEIEKKKDFTVKDFKSV